MKLFSFIFALLTAASALANERIFDCTATKIHSHLSLPSELQLQKNPALLFRQFGKSEKVWSLQIGELLLHTEVGPAVRMESSITTQYDVEYNFWVEGSYEYQLIISTADTSAQLSWWGTGEQTQVADFQCVMVEQ